jgi:carbon monoxide dehydrogenase subunit G
VRLDHEFTIPVPLVQAWPILLDVERIAPCMPGATVTKVDGADVEGVVKVKVGPITVAYGGTAKFLEVDEAGRRVVIEARGKETRGSGTASARVTTQMHDEGEQTRITVSTDLSITGKPAQFGRGVMADVGGRILGQFADCLSRTLAEGDEPAPAAQAANGQAPTAGGGTATGDSDRTAAGSAASATGSTATGDSTESTSAPGSPTATGAGGTTAGGPDSAAATGNTATGSTATGTSATGSTATTGSAPAGGPSSGPGTAAAQPRRTQPAPQVDDAIDLLGAAGVPILKRAAPVLAGVAALLLLLVFRRRRN